MKKGNNKDIYDEIVEKYRNSNGTQIIPFIGAGMSCFCGYKTWANSLLDMANDIVDSDKEDNVKRNIGKDVFSGSQALYNELGKKSFKKSMKRVFSNEKLKNCLKEDWKKSSDYLLPQLFSKNPIITTNYDQILEKVFSDYNKSPSKTITPYTPQLVTQLRQNAAHGILKLHGDISDTVDFTKIVFTNDQYKEAYKDGNPLPELLKEWFRNKNIFFFGCSLNQDKIMDILKEVVQEDDDVAHYAIVEYEDGKLNERKKQLENEYGILSIFYPKGEHESLHIVLEHLIKDVRGSENNNEDKGPKYYEFDGISLNEEANNYKENYDKTNLFLSNADEIKLKDVFVHPDYKVKVEKDCETKDFDEFFEENLQHTIIKDKKYPENFILERVLTVLGKPGTGKTSLVKYILSNEEIRKKLKSYGYKRIVLQKFSKLNGVKWNDNSIISSLLESCGFNKECLEKELEGTLLILDGFDEINLENSLRSKIVEKLCDYFNSNVTYKNYSHFMLIITGRDGYFRNIDECRANYPDDLPSKRKNIKNINFITLQPMPEFKIQQFCEKYNAKATNKYELDELKKILSSKDDRYKNLIEILGIPMILYMIVANPDPIHLNDNITDVSHVYDLLFRPDSGIFDPSEKMKGETLEDKKKFNEVLLKISKLISIDMFQYSPNQNDCSNETVEEIIKKVYDRTKLETNEVLTYGISDLKKHIVGDHYILPYTEKSLGLTFVHRSIYEYFTATYIFEQLEKLSKENKDFNFENNEIIKSLRLILQVRELSEEIYNYLDQRLIKEFNECFNQDEKESLYENLIKLFNYLLQNGFVYSNDINNTEFSSERAIVVRRQSSPLLVYQHHEIISFLNFLNIIRMVANKIGKEFVYDGSKNEIFKQYIRLSIEDYLNLRTKKINSILISDDMNKEEFKNTFIEESVYKLDFGNLNIERINLSGLNLSNILFDSSNLSYSQLKHCVFKNTSIKGAYFNNAKMSHCSLRQCVTDEKKINFNGANLRNSDFQSCNFNNADFSECHLEDSNFYRAQLQKSKFNGAYLNGTDMGYSTLNEATFYGAYLVHTNLEAADLSDVEFEDLNHENPANLTGSNFSGAVFTEETKYNLEQKKWIENGYGNLSEDK